MASEPFKYRGPPVILDHLFPPEVSYRCGEYKILYEDYKKWKFDHDLTEENEAGAEEYARQLEEKKRSDKEWEEQMRLHRIKAERDENMRFQRELDRLAAFTRIPIPDQGKKKKKTTTKTSAKKTKKQKKNEDEDEDEEEVEEEE
jgi:hypothetical protein